MTSSADILERLRIDPGRCTVGELLQDREQARHEIARLRAEIERLRSIPNRHSDPPPETTIRARDPGALIRIAEVCELVGVCRSTIYRWMSEGSFPEPVRLSEGAVRWRFADIARWRDAL